MCGLAGFIDVSRRCEGDSLQTIVRQMSETLRHRGPDDSGTWVDEDVGLALGHRRLAIIDLSSKGRQPMQSACGRYVIVYNGETYNFQVLRRELEGLNHTFKGHSDTEVVLAAISQWGLEAAVQRFNGMFAFALWDRKKRLLHLVRDRLGEKPLYYGWVGTCFLFGSELKALRAHPSFRGEIDRNALASYMRFKYIPTPYSIYKGIYKLLPGTILTITHEKPNLSPEPIAYWSAKEVVEGGVTDPFSGSPKEAIEQLETLLRDSIKLRMVADVPLGVFLSGGLDSSTVTALAQVNSSQPMRTFTIGFYEPDYNEAEEAKAVARHLGTEHTEFYVTPEESQAVIPRLPTLYDEPFSDPSQIPTYLVSALARQHVTVCLSGDVGDELFGGYTRYLEAQRIWPSIRWMPQGARNVAAKVLVAVSPRVWNTVARGVEYIIPDLAKKLQSGRKQEAVAAILSAETSRALYIELMSDWRDPASLVIGATEPSTPLTDSTHWGRVENFTHWMMYMDLVTYLPDDILVKVDRATMGTSLENRVPLLDHRVVEFAWRVPLGLKIRDGQGKWLLRQVLYRYVPRQLIERPKMGFGVPIDLWLRAPLREWAESLIDERRLRNEGFLHPEPVRQRWKDHLTGKSNWQYALWDVLMFQAWLEAQ
jgi:asparagine synthase (glutamine-hydrolysing)